MTMCTCGTCKRCQHRQYMRAQRERPRPRKPVILDALDRKALEVWQRHQDTGERRDPLASTWRAFEAMP